MTAAVRERLAEILDARSEVLVFDDFDEAIIERAPV
tara:strand:- start:1264 stop:1371 length:108 start_codon:yes stop_codon:yes gene_type:complete